MERRHPGQQLEQHAAQRVQVGGRGDGRARGTAPVPCSGPCRPSRRCWSPGRRRVVEDPAHAEVEDLDRPTAEQHHVGRLEVTVHDVDTDAVRGRQLRRRSAPHRCHPGNAGAAGPRRPGPQGSPVEEFHRDDRARPGASTPPSMIRGRSGMVEPAHDAHLAREALPRLAVGRVSMTARSGRAGSASGRRSGRRRALRPPPCPRPGGPRPCCPCRSRRRRRNRPATQSFVPVTRHSPQLVVRGDHALNHDREGGQHRSVHVRLPSTGVVPIFRFECRSLAMPPRGVCLAARERRTSR